MFKRIIGFVHDNVHLHSECELLVDFASEEFDHPPYITIHGN
jgi:hypothetical protein